jgi:hypothetical protein
MRHGVFASCRVMAVETFPHAPIGHIPRLASTIIAMNAVAASEKWRGSTQKDHWSIALFTRPKISLDSITRILPVLLDGRDLVMRWIR